MAKPEAVTPDPFFDPEAIGLSYRLIGERLPHRQSLLSGFRTGDVTSAQRGTGSEYDGLRAYALGDDVRYIDHAATARDPDHWPQIRTHYRDITPTVWIATDSLEGRSAVGPGYFSEQILALSAIMAVMTIADRMGLPSGIIATNGEVLYHSKQPEKGTEHLLKTGRRLASMMLQPEKPDGTAQKYFLDDALRHTDKMATENLVVVVSDFRRVAATDEDHGWGGSLRGLAAKRRNDVLAIELTNPWDFERPAGYSKLTGTKEIVRLKSGRRERTKQTIAYAEWAQEQQAGIDQALYQPSVKHMKLSTMDAHWLGTFRRNLQQQIRKLHRSVA